MTEQTPEMTEQAKINISTFGFAMIVPMNQWEWRTILCTQLRRSPL